RDQPDELPLGRCSVTRRNDWGRSAATTSKGADEQSSRRTPGSLADPGVCFGIDAPRAMPRSMDKDDRGIRTRLVDGGRRKEWRSRLVNVPVHRGSTILFDTIEELDGSRADLGDYSYGLQGTPTHWALSDALNGLEPG